MCQRTVCQDCGKFTWTGCGLHIAQVLAGLPFEQVCSCDDDRDSEHSWSITGNNSSNDSTAATARTGTSVSRPVPRYPLPFPSLSSAVEVTAAPTTQQSDHSGHCIDPSPMEYKLSKISSTSAETAAVRMAQQAAALEELRRIKEEKEKELKDANEGALQKLLHGLSEATQNPE